MIVIFAEETFCERYSQKERKIRINSKKKRYYRASYAALFPGICPVVVVFFIKKKHLNWIISARSTMI